MLFKNGVFRLCWQENITASPRASQSYKKRFMCENGQVAVVKCSPIWENVKKDFKTFPEFKSKVHSQIEAWKQKSKSASAGKGNLLSLWKNCSRKG